MEEDIYPTSEIINPDNPIEQIAPESVFTFPRISGFWRRLAAWLVDVLLLGVIGLILGFIFSSFLYTLGPYGRPIGLLFTIPYFGILNSKFGGGQTIGKRVMKIAVRDKNNQPIGLWRSVLRISILELPALFNQWAIPIFQNLIVVWLLTLIVFGLGGAILYTMVFNRKTRQGIHDLLLGTYVVYLPSKPIEAFPLTSRVHWIVPSIWVGIVAIGTVVLMAIAPSTISQAPSSSMKSLYNILNDDSRFFSIGINDNTIRNLDGKTSRALIVTAWHRGKIEESEKTKIVNGIVKTILDNTKNINEFDGIQVKLISAYDIGIASANFTFSYGNSIEDWRRLIYPNGSSSGFIPGLMEKTQVVLH